MENKDKPKKSSFPKPLPQEVIDEWVKKELKPKDDEQQRK